MTARFLRPQQDHFHNALTVLAAALDAADPAQAIRRMVFCSDHTLWVDGTAYDLRRFKRVVVVGGGKAGASMAAAIEEIVEDRITAGVVSVKYGYTAPTQIIEVREAAHPVPDEAGVNNTRAIVKLLREATQDDLVICLISGGGSALMTLPVEGVSLDDVQILTQTLLKSGAPIEALNAVRKHLSQVQGGQMARLAYPATLITLVLSDVVGSPLDVIASGPTVPDPTTFAHAQAVLARYVESSVIPSSIRRYLLRGLSGGAADTPKTDDEAFDRMQTVIIADNARAAQAAVEKAAEVGYHSLLLSTFVEGEAREVGRVLAALGKEIVMHSRPVPRPACLILGGETTVTVRGDGRGGRNQELALAAALAIQGWDDLVIASLGTDGTDGPTDAAGGVVDGSTVARGQTLGLSAHAALDQNDAYTFLSQTDNLLVTGPTNTNVNDLMAVFVE
ncbi:MAG TPA: glycerate kinase [Aggregatilineaceae bacterium]|nr:glycerate kinase [Aggregatilineaceae bacterium]